MAKHRSYGKKPYAKFFKNKKKDEAKGKTIGFRIGDEVFIDEDLKKYLIDDIESTKDMSLMFNNCIKLSTLKLTEYLQNKHKND